MGSDFYSYDQESRCKTSCTTIYKLGAKWRFEKNGRWMKLRKTKMVSTLELVSQHSLMMTIWSKKFFKFWHTRMYWVSKNQGAKYYGQNTTMPCFAWRQFKVNANICFNLPPHFVFMFKKTQSLSDYAITLVKFDILGWMTSCCKCDA